MGFLTISRQRFLDDWERINHRVKDLCKNLGTDPIKHIQLLEKELDRFFVDIVKEERHGKDTCGFSVDMASCEKEASDIIGS